MNATDTKTLVLRVVGDVCAIMAGGLSIAASIGFYFRIKNGTPCCYLKENKAENNAPVLSIGPGYNEYIEQGLDSTTAMSLHLSDKLASGLVFTHDYAPLLLLGGVLFAGCSVLALESENIFGE